jgi:hypothetical protein
MTKQIQIENVTTLPDRNFVAGYPRNPATYVATSDEGEYYEAFVSEHADQASFEREALAYFNRTDRRSWAA